MRWIQLEAALKRGNMPEPGFAFALRYIASGDAATGRRAIGWALDNPGAIRQAAIVYDWCHELLEDSERTRLSKSLIDAGRQLPEAETFSEVRDRLFAAVATAGDTEEFAAPEAHWLVTQWWRRKLLPALRAGEYAIPRSEIYPFMEILHVVHDNLQIDLRQEFKEYFVSLPVYLLLSYYPAVYPAPENDFHIPVVRDGGEPDARTATLARAADLSLVAYDSNAVETQFLQGWSMQDAFLMRGSFGIPYEFLWANPYHPGLSYYSTPRVLYDPTAGRLLARSSWDGDGNWLYYEAGVMQTFQDGIQPLTWSNFTEPMNLRGLVILPLHDKSRFSVETEELLTYYLLGLEPNTRYDIEVDEEGLYERRTDRSGILVMQFPPERKAGVRLKKSPDSPR